MYFLNSIPNQQPDEKLILFLRRHPIVLAGRLFLHGLMGLIPVILYFFLSYALMPEFQANPFFNALTFLLASIFYLFLLLFFFNDFVDYYLDVWIVTNQRIINIEQKGLFHREFAEHSLERIQDVSGEQKGFWQTFFHYGNVHVQTAGEVQYFIFRQVNHPFDVVRVINLIIEKKEDQLENELLRAVGHEGDE